jgi:enterochelin esterase-like enzyme
VVIGFPQPALRIASLVWLLLGTGSLIVAAEDPSSSVAAARQFRIVLDPALACEPRSGRLFVFTTQRSSREPRFGPNWFSPEPFCGRDVATFRPGQTETLAEGADAFPGNLSTWAAGAYRVQAVFDTSLDNNDPGGAPGNYYSDVVPLDVSADRGFVCDLRLQHLVPERSPPARGDQQEVIYRSDQLSKFFGRDVVEHCVVLLPGSYGAPSSEKRYPTVYVIPGFGGDHWQAAAFGRRLLTLGTEGREFIVVGLSGNCRWGHHVYANSATNGPRGESLVQELIPLIDARFRTLGEPAARFVTGHSSGGWASLWLQVTYPETFGGCWSLSPDPVDFRDFQQIDLYANPPLSLYFDEQGAPRPVARRGEHAALWFPGFGRMDDVLGRGGQLRSFEAVFSPLDVQGLPRRLWDRETGRIDPETAHAWEAYDIRLKLEREWHRIEPLLRRKLHIVTGELDTFYLEGAVRRLQQTLQKLGSDAEVEIIPGRDHGSVLTQSLFAKIHRQMWEAHRHVGTVGSL